jgi:hypothetical protein
MGRRETEFSTMIRLMPLGGWVYLNTVQERDRARAAARWHGMKVQILKTTAGRWRAERVS